MEHVALGVSELNIFFVFDHHSLHFKPQFHSAGLPFNAPHPSSLVAFG